MRHPVMLIGLGFLLLAQSISWALKGHLRWHQGLGALMGISAIAGGLYFWKQMGLPSFRVRVPMLILLALMTGLWVWNDYRRHKQEVFLEQKCANAIFSLMKGVQTLTPEERERGMQEVKRICSERR